MKQIMIIIFSFLLFGCVPQTANTEVLPAITPFPTGTLEASNILTVKTQPAIEAQFATTEVCSSDRYVFDSYPDFSEKASLVTLTNNHLSLVDVTTGRINIYDYILEDGVQPVVSLDGEHIAYLSGFGSEKKLWVFTPSTDEPPKPFSLPADTVFIRWINDKKLGLWNYPDEYGCQQYGGFFDIDSENVVEPNYAIPAMEQSRCIYLPSIGDDGLRVLYPWQLKDLGTGAIQDIFLPAKIETNPPNYFLGWSNENIFVMSYKEKTLSYIIDLSVKDLNEPVILRTVQMPAFATKDSYRISPIIDSNSKLLGWDLIEESTNILDNYTTPAVGNFPTNFYLVDLHANQFVDYCLNRSIPSNTDMENLATPQHKGYFSPESNYLAWTIYSNDAFTPPIETQILDITNGKVIVFPELEIFGWVVP
jgi:hypothetical protein